MSELVVYCADVGSIKSGNFGWARSTGIDGLSGADSGEDIDALVERLIGDLKDGRGVALGFECPLYVPVRNEPIELTSQREEEKGAGRPWSAGAGAAVLGVGLVEVMYVLSKLRRALDDENSVFLQTERFQDVEGGLLLWEAMVTGDAKPDSVEDEHAADARIAVEEFLDTYPNFEPAEGNREGVHSLIGSALLRTGWEKDPDLLSRPCVFVKPSPFP